jgi:hypothetical protein
VVKPIFGGYPENPNASVNIEFYANLQKTLHNFHTKPDADDQRFGQYYYNSAKGSWLTKEPWPELFYCTDTNMAIGLIVHKHVENLK